MSAASVRKGKSWERAVAIMFREAHPGCGAKRGFQFRGGDEDPDIRHPWFHIEAKHRKLVSLREALRQAERDTQEGKWPVVVAKDAVRNGEKQEFVFLKLEDFLEMTALLWKETH